MSDKRQKGNDDDEPESWSDIDEDRKGTDSDKSDNSDDDNNDDDYDGELTPIPDVFFMR